jgi:phenylacetate-CoA ligase
MDQVEVQVEITPEVFSDRIGTLEDLKAKLSHAIANTLGIRVEVHLAEPHALQRSEGKARRLIDKRNA